MTRGQVVGGTLTAVVLVVGIVVLRELTESRDTPTPSGSRTLVELHARTNAEHLGPSMHDVVSAAITTCRIELESDPMSPRPAQFDGGRYRAVLFPALDPTERARFEGCIEDWRIDHVLLEIVTMTTLEATP